MPCNAGFPLKGLDHRVPRTFTLALGLPVTYSNSSAQVIGTLTYSYDNAGRRTSMGGTLASTAQPTPVSITSYDTANRLQTWNTASLSYDANGNLISDGSNTYVWNARNQLSQIQNGSTVTASFGYDALGRRQTKTINGTGYGYVYDGDNVVQQLNGVNSNKSSANVLASYFTGLGIDENLALEPGNGTATQTFIVDALGSTLQLVDGAGSKKVGYTYDPYGNTTADTASLNLFQYAGRENDGTGLYFNRARYYAPGYGRFISQDPIGLNGGINNYAYVGGDPIRFRDPYGLYGMDNFIDDAADFSAGWGDELSFGITAQIRNGFDIGSVNKCSLAYKGGEVTGFANGIAIGWAQGTKAAAKAMSPTNWSNFSHSLFPKRFLKQFDNDLAEWLNQVGNRLNGDFIPAGPRPDLHDLMDGTAAGIGGSFETWPAWRQLINRIPYVPGSAAYGGASAAANGCGCE